MTVSDVFVIKNRGVVATGQVDSGVLRVGDMVRIDGGEEVEVTGIEKFRKKLDEATAGENIGVLLKGIEKAQIGRGAVLTSSGGDAAPFIV